MMKKTMLWRAGFAVIALASAGALLAQKAEAPEDTTHDQFFYFNSMMEGHARLGVRIGDVTTENMKELKAPGEYGAVVESVSEDSPAAKAGLKKDDVILEFAGERVWSARQLRRMISDTPAGRTVRFKVSREGKPVDLSVKLQERHEAFAGPRVEIPRIEVPEVHIPDFKFDIFVPHPRLGISADELTEQLASYFGVKEGKGVLVREVLRGTPAEKGGLKAGDCIVKAGSKEVGSVQELHNALAEASRDKPEVTLTIVRDRKEQTVTVTIEKPERTGPGRVAEEHGWPVLDRDDLEQMTGDIKAQTEDLQNLKETLRQETEQWKVDQKRALEEQRQEMEQLNRQLRDLELEGGNIV